MRTILARIRILPGKEAQAEEAIRTMAAAVEGNEPGARSYTFYRNRKDPLDIVVFEQYADDQAAAAHAASEHMGQFRAHFGSLFDPAAVKIETLEEVAGFAR